MIEPATGDCNGGGDGGTDGGGVADTPVSISGATTLPTLPLFAKLSVSSRVISFPPLWKRKLMVSPSEFA